MISEYIQIPPPDERWYIVYPIDLSHIKYGELTDTENNLGYNYDIIEIYEHKVAWIARLLVSGIEYIE